jgi:hypothetical protein
MGVKIPNEDSAQSRCVSSFLRQLAGNLRLHRRARYLRLPTTSTPRPKSTLWPAMAHSNASDDHPVVSRKSPWNSKPLVETDTTIRKSSPAKPWPQPAPLANKDANLAKKTLWDHKPRSEAGASTRNPSPARSTKSSFDAYSKDRVTERDRSSGLLQELRELRIESRPSRPSSARSRSKGPC